jgi:hypothetical protein
MKTRFLFVLLLVLVSLTSPGRAQFPKLLDDWQSWVLWDETKHGGKPTAFDDKTKMMPLWYAPMDGLLPGVGQIINVVPASLG